MLLFLGRVVFFIPYLICVLVFIAPTASGMSMGTAGYWECAYYALRDYWHLRK